VNFLLTIGLAVLLTAPHSFAQFTAGGRLSGKRVQGQVRLAGEPAPQGVLVLLDRARGRDSSFTGGSGELGNTMTDSRGKFMFENIDAGEEVPEGATYVVTVRFPGYLQQSQIITLTASPAGFLNFDLRPDKSGAAPNLPPGGPAGMISANQPASSQGQQALARGETLLVQKHDPQASIEEFKSLIKVEPKYAPGYMLLGTAYMQTQNWGEARSAFEKVVKLEPANANAFVGIGAALNAQQDYNGARTVLEKGLHINPKSSEGQYELGRSLWALGQWQEAEPHVRKAIELNPAFPLPHIIMGNIFLRRRDANSAMTEYRQYLKLDPQGPQSGAVQAMMARIEKALGSQKK